MGHECCLQAAFESLLLLDKAFINEADATNPEVAEAINKAFEEHVPSFNYSQQVNVLEAAPQLFACSHLSQSHFNLLPFLRC